MPECHARSIKNSRNGARSVVGLVERRELLDSLTDRQREVLEVAVEAGYYDVPREASHEDVATALDCAPSTASEHLRKVEAQIMAGLVVGS